MREDAEVTRIVAGRAGGRRLRVPPRGTRPTAERVREALFNALEAAGDIAGARVLDLYAGSGALGLEALSRGAATALFVESDRRAARILAENVRALGLGGAVRETKVSTLLASAPSGGYDLVLVDPPYELAASVLASVLTMLVERDWLADGALVAVERASRDGAPNWPDGLRPWRVKTFGDTSVFLAEVGE